MALTDERGFWLDKKGNAVHPDNIRATDALKDELVEKLTLKAKELNEKIRAFRDDGYEELESYYKLLLEEYNMDEKANSKKGNLQIENFSATAKVTVGVADRLNFDEKLSIAKLKIDEYLHEITQGTHADIQTLITKAFEVDKKGNIDARKILALRSYNIAHPKWAEAMEIISQSVEVIGTKAYIRFYARENINDEYKMIALDIAGV